MDIYTWIIFKEPQGMSSHLHAWHQKMRKHLFNKICSIHMGYPVFGITTYQQHNSKIENVFSIAATISCISDMAGFRHIITYNWQPSYYQHCDSDLTTYIVLRPGKNAAVWFLGQMLYLGLLSLVLLLPACRRYLYIAELVCSQNLTPFYPGYQLQKGKMFSFYCSLHTGI